MEGTYACEKPNLYAQICLIHAALSCHVDVSLFSSASLHFIVLYIIIVQFSGTFFHRYVSAACITD